MKARGALAQIVMDIAELVDSEVMAHLALYGCIQNADPMIRHLVKTSSHPLLVYRRNWMRATALRQHLERQRRQVKHNDLFKEVPRQKGASMQQMASLDPGWSKEQLHYNGASWNDKSFIGDVRREAPKIFPHGV